MKRFSIIKNFSEFNRNIPIQRKKIKFTLLILFGSLNALFDLAIALLIGLIFSNDEVYIFLNYEIDITKASIPKLLIAGALLRAICVLFLKYNESLFSIQITDYLKKWKINSIFKNPINHDVGKTNFDILYTYNDLSNLFVFYLLLSTLGIQLIIFLVVIFIFYGNTGFLFFALSALVLFLPRNFMKLIQRKNTERLKAGIELSDFIEKILNNIFLIKIYKKDDQEIYRTTNLINKFSKVRLFNIFFEHFFYQVPLSGALVFIGIYFSINQFETISGAQIALLIIFIRVIQILTPIAQSIQKIFEADVLIAEINKEFKSKLTSVTQGRYKFFNSKANIFELDNVTFSYGDQEEKIIENISLEIPLKKHTVITGKNGSGKSTILGMLANILPMNKGEIRFSGNKIAYIGPDPLIFKGTLKENILYGNDNKVDDNEILKVLNEINFYEINNREINLYLEIDHGGKNLSSGQQQKLSFARVLIQEFDTLLLDEATSNLDKDSIEIIFNKLNKKNLSIINISHTPEKFKTATIHLNLENKKINKS